MVCFTFSKALGCSGLTAVCGGGGSGGDSRLGHRAVRGEMGSPHVANRRVATLDTHRLYSYYSDRHFFHSNSNYLIVIYAEYPNAFSHINPHRSWLFQPITRVPITHKKFRNKTESYWIINDRTSLFDATETIENWNTFECFASFFLSNL